MSDQTLYVLMLSAHFALFLIAPVVLIRLGFPVLAGLVMLASTLLPIAGQAWFTDSEMPGAAFLLIVEAPIAALVLVAGVAVSVNRTRKRISGNRYERGDVKP